MGEINRHPIAKYRKQYNLRAFVETGTWRGDGVLTAVKAGFSEVWTIEASEKQAAAAAQRLARHVSSSTHFVVGDSVEILPRLIEEVPHPALFWLDAHYPERYEGDDVTALPLLGEVATIVGAERDHSGDVIVADDLRIYGQVGASGALPKFLTPGSPDELRAIWDALSPTHDIVLDRRDGVYLIALPQGA